MKPLGPPLRGPAPAPVVEQWVPVKGRAGIERSTTTGYLRNNTPTPAPAPPPPHIEIGGYPDITLTTQDGQDVMFIKGLAILNLGKHHV